VTEIYILLVSENINHRDQELYDRREKLKLIDKNNIIHNNLSHYMLGYIIFFETIYSFQNQSLKKNNSSGSSSNGKFHFTTCLGCLISQNTLS
jgi:hypothetical protein